MDKQIFNLDHQFDLYLERTKQDKNKMPSIQLQETKRAFYGACGQMLVLLRDDITALPDEQAMDTLDDMMNQVGSFWIGEQHAMN